MMVTEPTNKNFLGQTGFKLVLDRAPTVTYFCQNVPIPSIQLNTTTINTPLIDYTRPGTKLQFSPLSLTFRVDEDMVNYIEIYNWLIGIGAPSKTEQRRLYEATSVNNNIFSDATLFVLSSKYNPNLKIKFHNMFPESISELQFSSTVTDIDYLEASIIFQYTLFTFESV